MTITIVTERLDVQEVAAHPSIKVIEPLLTAITKTLTPTVVENLPPYFHDIVTIEDAKHWLDKMLDESRLLLVKEQSSNEIIGFLFISNSDYSEAHIGYLLSEKHWGKGLATELLSGFIEMAARLKQWKKLVGGVDVTNKASSKLLTRLGFKKASAKDGIVFYEITLVK